MNSAAADGHNRDDVRAIELLVRRYADICDEAY
ncbi:MAG: hypothetical protein JWR64_1723, partial [Marmoricola sp.]|nr:hypothetical protein [Marmoricola sp.]